MNWPSSGDYNDVIQNPAFCFSDEQLARCGVKTDVLGLPLARSGNFADVYELTDPQDGSRWAIKCFTRGDADRLHERYSEISEHLSEVGLPFMVEFIFLDKGILVQDQWYPALKMRWIEGQSLWDFVAASLDRPALLDAMAQIFLRVSSKLRDAGMAHGDLQHGNILMVPGSDPSKLAMRLIDYDGMWVPTLENVHSGELGHVSYQHPQRMREKIYSPHVDRFPLLVILTALRCLKVGGRSLWSRYYNPDNLLFRPEDFQDPERSLLFAELLRLSDPDALFLVKELQRSCGNPLDMVPWVDELLRTPPQTPVTRRADEEIPIKMYVPPPEAAIEDFRSTPAEGPRSGIQPRPKPNTINWKIVAPIIAVGLFGLLLLVIFANAGPGTGTLTVVVDQPGVDLVIDNQPIKSQTDKNSTTATIVTVQGSHEIIARRKGYEDSHLRVVVTAESETHRMKMWASVPNKDVKKDAKKDAKKNTKKRFD